MESAFSYDCIATGFNFLSRKRELQHLSNLMADGKNVVIYEPPKTGKSSLIEAAFKTIEKDGRHRIIRMNFQMAISADTVRSIMADALKTETGSIDCDSIKDDFGSGLLKEVANKSDKHIILYIKEFHNLTKISGWENILRFYEKGWQRMENISFLLSGSCVNAMKYIFEERKSMYNLYERVKLYPIEEKAVVDHIKKTFLRVGRVVETRHGERIYQTVEGHPWYVWQIANTCFNLTKGYLVDSIIDYAIDTVLSLHEVRFKEIMSGLSYYQVLLLKAIFEGQSKINSSSVIEEYGLNSSANVHRLKEALTKKEVIIFDHQGNPGIIDPLFRLWLERTYFNKR